MKGLFVAVMLSSATAMSCANPSLAQPMPRDGILALERGACEGECPAYVLDLDATGLVHWEGRAHVAQLGSALRRIDPAVVSDLWIQVRALDPDAYRKDPSTSCDDEGFVELTVGAGEERSTIRDEYCSTSAAFDRLRAVADRIDATAEASRWIEGDAR
jgi:hypothetical protein